MSKNKVLGRGLSVILNKEDHFDESKYRSSVSEVLLSQIEVNPYQPRRNFKKEALQELSDSIRELGVIQPITIRKIALDRYQIISGERRFRASKLAGLKTITSYVREANDKEMLEMALVENIQRQDLDAIEVAISYNRLLEELNMTQEQVSQRVGKKRSTVSNYLRLLRLDPIIQSGIRDEMISMGHGKALMSVEDIDIQLEFYEKIIKGNLSVRQTENLVKGILHTKQKNNTKVSNLPNNYKKSLKKMIDLFDAEISIKRNSKGKGSILINFDSDNEFEDIIKIINK